MRRRIRRVASRVIGLTVLFVLSGCSLSGIKFTNVSDTWLNVWCYVGTTGEATNDGPNELYCQKVLQVEPGDSVHYRPPKALVHLQVETITPTWLPSGRSYWIEMLTPPPLHVIASGRDDRLEFKSFEGKVAIIPEQQRVSGRFVYHTSQQQATGTSDDAEPIAGAANE